MANIAVVGAGPMGLAATHELLKLGHNVTLYEADSVVGGMSAAVNFDGVEIERFYHFICTSDTPYFEVLDELGIKDKLRWTTTKMGYYHGSKLQDWGDPFALLRFSGVSLVAKIRYGLLAFVSSRRKTWKALDRVNAKDWLIRWVGEEAWSVFWEPLFKLKFFRYTDNLSAEWIWARIRRIGTSRKNLFAEQLGYLEGGTQTYLDAVSHSIGNLGGEIKVGAPVEEILIKDNKAVGVRCDGREVTHDSVISTVPLPFISDMVPALPEDTRRAYQSVNNIAVVCVLVKLSRPFSKYFWLNISDSRMNIPGAIEYTNLCPKSENILYIPYYMPQDHEDYQRPNSWFYERSREYLQLIDKSLADEEVLAMSAGRYEYAQPICPPGFMDRLPPISPNVENLFIADTSYYYPEDRSVSESIKLGRELASMCQRAVQSPT